MKVTAEAAVAAGAVVGSDPLVAAATGRGGRRDVVLVVAAAARGVRADSIGGEGALGVTGLARPRRRAREVVPGVAAGAALVPAGEDRGREEPERGPVGQAGMWRRGGDLGGGQFHKGTIGRPGHGLEPRLGGSSGLGGGQRALECGPVERPAVRREHVLDRQLEERAEPRGDLLARHARA